MLYFKEKVNQVIIILIQLLSLILLFLNIINSATSINALYIAFIYKDKATHSDIDYRDFIKNHVYRILVISKVYKWCVSLITQYLYIITKKKQFFCSYRSKDILVINNQSLNWWSWYEAVNYLRKTIDWQTKIYQV